MHHIKNTVPHQSLIQNSRPSQPMTKLVISKLTTTTTNSNPQKGNNHNYVIDNMTTCAETTVANITAWFMTPLTSSWKKKRSSH